MMNLEKMKQKKRTITKSRVKKSLLAATTFLCLTTPLLQTQTAYAAENTTPAITIEKPDGWKQGETTIAVTVDASHMPEGFSIAKIEAKAGKDGSWQDVTGSGSITITGNQTVYVRVTDGEGKVYEQNRSIKCYDTEKPTLSASLTDGVLTIQGNDTVSGITAVTVNGTTYTDLKDGMLRVQLTQKDFTTKQIEITVTDGAGNTSEKYVLQNPYYEWAKKQAEKQKTSGDSNGAMATTTSADATGTEKTTTSPLPQDAQASEPTDAKGTVDDRTVTGIEEQLNKEGETADSVTKTATEGTKEFYTISTKSGKIFYLIIDNSKSQDNVYFLTEVSEKDLMNFTLSDSVTLPEVDTVYAEPEKKAEEEVQMTCNKIYDTAGICTSFVRPPFGEWRKNLDLDMTMIPVSWNVDSLDWTTENTEKIIKRVVKDVEEDDIILMHDVYKTSVEAALQIVDILKERGYEFVTVDKLLLE